MNDPAQATALPPLRIVLAAGGTGGHLMPALATAEALARRLPCEFLLVGSPRASERSLRAGLPYPCVEIDARPLAGAGLHGKLLGIGALPWSVVRARRILRGFAPDLVIATGGYVCGPTGIAARTLGVPLLVLEQNAEPGLTTRALRPFAAAIAVSFPVTARRLGGKAVVTGNPIRATLPAAAVAEGATEQRRRRDRRSVHLLILGGSQGARGLNTMVELAIPFLAGADVGLTVTHQTGVHDVERLSRLWREHAIPASVTPFIHDIGRAYGRADLVCARAGATTLAELAYCGLPSVLVPFPRAAGRHQHANAAAFAAAGAAIVVEERPEGGPLAAALLQVATDPARRAAMAAAAARLGRRDAADAVAELALALLGRAAGRGRGVIPPPVSDPAGESLRTLEVS